MSQRGDPYGGHPPRLLDEHLERFGRQGRSALPGTAIRTRSLDARHLLARAAGPGAVTLDELLSVARAGDVRWLKHRRAHLTPRALADLARVLALQDLLPGDADDALALYDLILGAYGGRVLPPLHQGFHARAALLAGREDQARSLLRRYRRVPRTIRTELNLDLTNPFVRPGPVQPWLAGFATLLPPPAITVGAGDAGHPFDRLGTAPAAPVDGPQRISVVVSTYRPGDGLLTAVRSILAQSWSNLEVLVVDDASPAEFDGTLARCVDLDLRVRVLRMAVNGGTYVARNAALDETTGEFVTFQDSDDWSHPRRLELQVRPLIADPTLVATTSDGINVTDELLLNRAGVRSARLNPSALLLRRDVALRRLGYFDVTRKAADSEYLGRLTATFGERALHHVDEPLALIRLTPNSLSRGEIQAHWMHPARVAYMSAYRRWHARIAAGTADPYRPREPGRRPFAAPAHLRGGVTGDHDVVFAGDWIDCGGPQQVMLDEIRALTARGLRVAVLHLQAYLPMRPGRLPLCAPIQDLINDGTVGQLQLTDDSRTGVVLVRGPDVLQFAAGGAARLRADRVSIVADRAPTTRDGTRWRYAPAVATHAVRRIFGVQPRWHPQDPAIAAALAARLAPELLGPALPLLVDADRWERTGTRWRGDRPVLGHDVRDAPTERCADHAALLAVYPADTTVDVRLRGALQSGADLLLKEGLPARWLVYAAADLSARDFLHQLDFYVAFPPPNVVELLARPTLEALAVGCVTVLPHRFADTYGDAAVYCEPHEVPDLVQRYWADPRSYAAQSRAGGRWAREHFAPDRYADQIVALL